MGSTTHGAMPEVLLISKPVAPPWNDSNKNLVRDLARFLERYDPVVMGRRGGALELGRGRVETPYPARSGGFAPALSDNARVLSRLLTGRRSDLWHFFFAPNPRTSTVGRLASGLRRVPTVHTVASAPRAELDPAPLLFADRTVVLSRSTEERLLSAGVPPERLARIPPCIPPLSPLDDRARAAARRRLDLPTSGPLVVYPGDLEFGRGASQTLDAVAALGRDDLCLVMACRTKTPRAREVERSLRGRSVEGVRWIGETPHIHDLLGAADVVVLPSETLYAKMDHPLVILEAMSLARPVVVARGTPAEELASDGAAVVIEPEVGALRTALSTLIDDADARAGLGRRARSRVLEQHAPGRMASAYEAVYDGLLR